VTTSTHQHPDPDDAVLGEMLRSEVSERYAIRPWNLAAMIQVKIPPTVRRGGKTLIPITARRDRLLEAFRRKAAATA
jgi:hypothetical protein